MAFLRDLQSAGAPISVEMIGNSPLGRAIPLVIASYPPVSSPAEARRLGKPIVYVEANIHAGEVEGKEAIMAILRRLSQEGPHGLLGKIVLLATPIYNIDGNEKFAPVAVNRPEQDGPAMVGERANGAGLDLNRDGVKTESPEMQAALKFVYTSWDPDVMMDLHTTDGTRHGWELTYSPPLNPNTDAGIMKFTRDRMLPYVRKKMFADFGLKLFDYGNAERRNGQTAWYTYGCEGRYCTNYEGIRSRISVLSEATTYIPFRDRVNVTDKFVTAVLQYVAGHAADVIALTKGADAKVVGWGLDPRTAPALGVRFDFDQRGTETVLLEKSPPAGQKPPYSTRPEALNEVRMPIFDRFKATKTARFPAAYLVPAAEQRTIGLLLKHGIKMERFVSPWTGTVSAFHIDRANVARSPFQGHRLITLDGEFGETSVTAETGDYLVRTAQPLGVLAFHILEPEGTDGAAAWGFLGESFQVGEQFPIKKLFEPPNARTDIVRVAE